MVKIRTQTYSLRPGFLIRTSNEAAHDELSPDGLTLQATLLPEVGQC